MGHVSFQLRSAVPGDAPAISRLLRANLRERGGALLGDWQESEILARILRGDLILVAHEDIQLLGVLITEEYLTTQAAPVLAMLDAWPPGPSSYVYGPVCIAESARGRGLLKALYAELQRRRSDGEAILFIRADNESSLRAHLRLGLKAVAQFTFSGEPFWVLSDRRAM
jgi:predicted GNAT superfamily acetyltransferase